MMKFLFTKEEFAYTKEEVSKKSSYRMVWAFIYIMQNLYIFCYIEVWRFDEL